MEAQIKSLIETVYSLHGKNGEKKYKELLDEHGKPENILSKLHGERTKQIVVELDEVEKENMMNVKKRQCNYLIDKLYPDCCDIILEELLQKNGGNYEKVHKKLQNIKNELENKKNEEEEEFLLKEKIKLLEEYKKKQANEDEKYYERVLKLRSEGIEIKVFKLKAIEKSYCNNRTEVVDLILENYFLREKALQRSFELYCKYMDNKDELYNDMGNYSYVDPYHAYFNSSVTEEIIKFDGNTLCKDNFWISSED